MASFALGLGGETSWINFITTQRSIGANTLCTMGVVGMQIGSLVYGSATCLVLKKVWPLSKSFKMRVINHTRNDFAYELYNYYYLSFLKVLQFF